MGDFYTALGLVLVIEGLIYALFPDGMQRAMRLMQEMPPASLRLAGLVAATIGVVVVWLVRGGQAGRPRFGLRPNAGTGAQNIPGWSHCAAIIPAHIWANRNYRESRGRPVPGARPLGI